MKIKDPFNLLALTVVLNAIIGGALLQWLSPTPARTKLYTSTQFWEMRERERERGGMSEEQFARVKKNLAARASDL